MTGSDKQDNDQRIKNPSNPKNSEMEGVGMTKGPVKSSFFLFGGVRYSSVFFALSIHL